MSERGNVFRRKYSYASQHAERHKRKAVELLQKLNTELALQDEWEHIAKEYANCVRGIDGANCDLRMPEEV